MEDPILVVDDESCMLRCLERTLRPIRPVVRASSVMEAVRVLRSSQGLAAALIDWNLPDGTGHDVLTCIRDHRPGLPAAVITGYADAQVARSAYQSSAPLLIKPLEPEVVRSFVRDQIGDRARLVRRVETVVERWRALYTIRPASVEVLRRRALGDTTAAIVADLGICELTFKKHVHNLLAATGGDTFEGEVSRLLREACGALPPHLGARTPAEVSTSR